MYTHNTSRIGFGAVEIPILEVLWVYSRLSFALGQKKKPITTEVASWRFTGGFLKLTIKDGFNVFAM